MNEHKIASGRQWQYGGKFLAAVLGIALFAGTPLYAADPVDATKSGPAKKKTVAAKVKKSADASSKALRPIPSSTELVPQMELELGQSHLIRLPETARLERVSVDNPELLQITVTSLREVVLHAKKAGSTVVIFKDKSGQSTVMDVTVVGATIGQGVSALQARFRQLLPEESGIKVSSAGDSLVLTGTVSDALKVDKALMLAEAYAGKESKVLNLLKVSAPQQVMLEVKMAEVSKNILDKLGAQFNASRTNGGVAYAIAAGFLSLTGANPLSPGGLLTITKDKTVIKIDAENKDGVVKILAEPNIMAISGQEGSFLAGGKVLIPVAQSAATGTSSITLEEKEFGVGLKFTPTVLEGDLINLRVAPEVSELSQTGTAVSIGGTSSVLPSFTTRRASTTVQLHDGQSFAIAGLIKSNVTESIRRFPILGDIPFLGALFRSTEFQNDKTELLFVITPRLVKPLPPDYALPTDGFVQPTPKELFLEGKLEGKPAAPGESEAKPGKAAKDQPSAAAPAPQGDASGYEMK